MDYDEDEVEQVQQKKQKEELNDFFSKATF